MKAQLVSAFGAGVLVATVALGTVQDAGAAGDSVITACANKSSGAMRLLKRGSCRPNETRVSWNQQGSQGPAGPKGDTGATGPKGDTGARGVAGTNATVSTTSVTLKYLAAKTFSGMECGEGSATVYTPGHAYWGLFLDAWTSGDLQNSSRWTSLKSCEITLKVVSP